MSFMGYDLVENEPFKRKCCGCGEIVLTGIISLSEHWNNCVGKGQREALDVLFGEIRIASTGQKGNIVEVSGVQNSGSITLTVRPQITEDAEFEIVTPKLNDKQNLNPQLNNIK